VLLLAIGVGGDLDLLRGGAVPAKLILPAIDADPLAARRRRPRGSRGLRGGGRGRRSFLLLSAAAGHEGERRGERDNGEGLPHGHHMTPREVGLCALSEGLNSAVRVSQSYVVRWDSGCQGFGPENRDAAPRTARSRRAITITSPTMTGASALPRRLEVSLALAAARVEADEERLAGPASRSRRRGCRRRRGSAPTAAAKGGKLARPGGRCRGAARRGRLRDCEQHVSSGHRGGAWTSPPIFQLQRTSPFLRGSRATKRRSVVPRRTCPSSSTTGGAHQRVCRLVAPEDGAGHEVAAAQGPVGLAQEQPGTPGQRGRCRTRLGRAPARLTGGGLQHGEAFAGHDHHIFI
jgi:hypothetical protein